MVMKIVPMVLMNLTAKAANPTNLLVKTEDAFRWAKNVIKDEIVPTAVMSLIVHVSFHNIWKVPKKK